MSKCKLTDYFKPGNNKYVRKDVDSTVQNEPITETTSSHDKEVVTIIVIRNGKIVWKVVWIEYYLRQNLSCQRY